MGELYPRPDGQGQERPATVFVDHLGSATAEAFATAPGRGTAHWYARAIWEEYAGRFRQERTGELYVTPASAV